MNRSWTRRWHDRETPPRPKRVQSATESDNPSAFLREAAPNLHECCCFHPAVVHSSSAETLAELDDSCKARKRRLAHFKVEDPSYEPNLPNSGTYSPGPRGAAPSPPSCLLSLPNSQTRAELALPLLPAPLSPSYARTPPLRLSSAHQGPTVRSGSCISDVDEGGGGGGGGVMEEKVLAEAELVCAPYNNSSQTHTLTSFFLLFNLILKIKTTKRTESVWFLFWWILMTYLWQIQPRTTLQVHLHFLKLIPASCAKRSKQSREDPGPGSVLAAKTVYDPV